MTSLYLPKENITLHIGNEITFSGKKERKTVRGQVTFTIAKFIKCGPLVCSDCETDGWYAIGPLGVRGSYCPTFYDLIPPIPLITINKVIEL